MNKFSQDIEQVLLPLKGFLDFNLIKTEEELMLTYAIMMKDYFIQTLEDSTHKNRELKRFDSTKDNMIKWLEILKTRDTFLKENDYGRLIEELEKIEFIERTTIHSTANDRKLHAWFPMYKTGLNTGRDRAMNIVKGIEKWVLHINPLIHKNRKYKDIEKFNTTRKNIDKVFHNRSVELYNRLDIDNNEEEEIQTTDEAKARAEVLTKASIRREKQRQKEHD